MSTEHNSNTFTEYVIKKSLFKYIWDLHLHSVSVSYWLPADNNGQGGGVHWTWTQMDASQNQLLKYPDSTEDLATYLPLESACILCLREKEA